MQLLKLLALFHERCCVVFIQTCVVCRQLQHIGQQRQRAAAARTIAQALGAAERLLPPASSAQGQIVERQESVFRIVPPVPDPGRVRAGDFPDPRTQRQEPEAVQRGRRAGVQSVVRFRESRNAQEQDHAPDGVTLIGVGHSPSTKPAHGPEPGLLEWLHEGGALSCKKGLRGNAHLTFDACWETRRFRLYTWICHEVPVSPYQQLLCNPLPNPKPEQQSPVTRMHYFWKSIYSLLFFKNHLLVLYLYATVRFFCILFLSCRLASCSRHGHRRRHGHRALPQAWVPPGRGYRFLLFLRFWNCILLCSLVSPRCREFVL